MVEATPAGRSPLVVDSSALLCRYLGDRRAAAIDLVIDGAVAGDENIVVTALARTEVTMAVHQALGRRASAWPADGVQARIAADWDGFWVVPLDGRCLIRATEIGIAYGLNVTNALHLAAVDRLPRPARFLTVDDRQVVAAESMGFDIVAVDANEVMTTAHGLLAET